MENYAICGSSAGGHLAASWCTKDIGYAVYEKPRPAAAILVYPVISFLGESDGETQRNLLGNEPSDELRHLLSIQEHVDGDYPPTYVWVFVEDGLKTNAELMEKTLEKAGVEHIARYFTGGRHGIGLAEGTEAEGWLTEAVAFWQDHIN
jgi:acetyl esterase/lipase